MTDGLSVLRGCCRPWDQQAGPSNRQPLSRHRRAPPTLPKDRCSQATHWGNGVRQIDKLALVISSMGMMTANAKTLDVTFSLDVTHIEGSPWSFSAEWWAPALIL